MTPNGVISLFFSFFLSFFLSSSATELQKEAALFPCVSLTVCEVADHLGLPASFLLVFVECFLRTCGKHSER